MISNLESNKNTPASSVPIAKPTATVFIQHIAQAFLLNLIKLSPIKLP